MHCCATADRRSSNGGDNARRARWNVIVWCVVRNHRKVRKQPAQQTADRKAKLKQARLDADYHAPECTSRIVCTRISVPLPSSRRPHASEAWQAAYRTLYIEVLNQTSIQ